MARPLEASSKAAPLGSAHLALLAAQVCFGLFPVFGKLAMSAFEPLAVASLRVATGGLVLGLAAAALHGRAALLARGDVPRLLVCAALGVLANQLLFLEGLQRSTAVHAGLIVCLIPVSTFALAALAGQERFSRRRAIGIAVALSGALALFFDRHGSVELRRDQLVGNLMMVANGICYSAYLVLSRPLAARYPPLVLIAWVYVFAGLALPWLVAQADWSALRTAPADAWWSLAYVLVFATIASYLLIGYALARLHASTTAVFNYLQPFVAAVAAVQLLGEQLRPVFWIAAALLFAGLWLVTFGRNLPRLGGRSPS